MVSTSRSPGQLPADPGGPAAHPLLWFAQPRDLPGSRLPSPARLHTCGTESCRIKTEPLVHSPGDNKQTDLSLFLASLKTVRSLKQVPLQGSSQLNVFVFGESLCYLGGQGFHLGFKQDGTVSRETHGGWALTLPNCCPLVPWRYRKARGRVGCFSGGSEVYLWDSTQASFPPSHLGPFCGACQEEEVMSPNMRAVPGEDA
ncbi:Hypothetical predicted protein [Marmota monax]|uniref:Uncharacterized protein n=1 Tax=Marmota monax TaxID=9995 RepID=A0A5E4CRM9_MARMO|nr:Hypothetical predicted protein [Marmota monax]